MNFYKIIQGDCFDIIPTMPKGSIDLIVTDPPYNLPLEKNSTILIANRKVSARRKLDFDFVEFPIDKFVSLIGYALKDGGAFYIFCGDKQFGTYIQTIEKHPDLVYSMFLVWYSKMGCPSVRKKAYQSHCQLIIFGHKEITEKYTFNYSKPTEMRNLLNVNGCTSFEYKHGKVGEWIGHPTQKPKKLIKKLIQDSSNEGDVVLDPFLGSGTTMSACQDLKRSCIGIEIDQKYYEMAKNRCYGKQFLDRQVNYEMCL
jgi:DNA modification methylase